MGNVKGGIRLAASDDKNVSFSMPNLKKLVSEHPKKVDVNAPNPENVDSL